jgi:hypothetical protein
MPKILGFAFFTMNPKKLGLHFSDVSVILYGFFKNPQITYTI